ncbi:hypothetical protein G5V65_02580 [Rhodobacter sp. HX-7-19]|uniref:Uncharacterized protein n=1 Tax=Paragemmobacter kunshanensis TaxID=2583234 RepID=A0A6M1TP26_9RHOB|nr:hypothetical protein [Rhodobacter kunshanensis]NGQ89767.1 hypothetical protein [Rhodobacter kunshanensis]
MHLLPVLIALFPMASHAACIGETYLDCPTTDGRRIEACIGAEDFTYRLGQPGSWELELSVPISAGTVTPWPGVGGSIWSSVGFPNAGYLYEVWASVDRNPDDINPSGGVIVLKGEEIVARLECASGTVTTPAFVLEDAMAMRGWCYDLTSFSWQKGSCAAP